MAKLGEIFGTEVWVYDEKHFSALLFELLQDQNDTC
jgi:hypothetical protein